METNTIENKIKELINRENYYGISKLILKLAREMYIEYRTEYKERVLDRVFSKVKQVLEIADNPKS